MEKQWNIILLLIFILEYFWIMDTELNMEYLKFEKFFKNQISNKEN